jgi:hypothetical protein
MNWRVALAVGICVGLLSILAVEITRRRAPARDDARREPRLEEVTAPNFVTNEHIVARGAERAAPVTSAQAVEEVVDSGEDDPEPTAEDCQLCLRTTCEREVSSGADVSGAACFLACERNLPAEVCKSRVGPPLLPRGLPRLICPDHERTAAVEALMACGRACPCPMEFTLR